jgi:predicted ferric reductase
MTSVAIGAHREPFVRTLLLLLALLSVLLPGLQWLGTAQTLWAWPDHAVPTGQVLYLLSKLFALYAIVALVLQISYGLLGPARVALDLEYGMRFHRALGLVTITLFLLHAASFVGAASWRTGHFAAQFAWPDFSHGYYRERISIGWWAGLALLCVVAVAIGRARLGRLWRYAHWLAFPAAIGVVVHSVSIGTESRMPFMLAAYGAMASVFLLAAYGRLFIRPRTSSFKAHTFG